MGQEHALEATDQIFNVPASPFSKTGCACTRVVFVLLRATQAQLGKKWAAIAREIPGRTEHAVKGRFKVTINTKNDGEISTHPCRSKYCFYSFSSPVSVVCFLLRGILQPTPTFISAGVVQAGCLCLYVPTKMLHTCAPQYKRSCGHFLVYNARARSLARSLARLSLSGSGLMRCGADSVEGKESGPAAGIAGET